MTLGLMDLGFLGAAGGERDPSFSSVSLLLHGNGTNGNTTIADNSPSPKTVTAVGNAQISTAQSKFGGASIAFDGSGDYLSVPSNSAFAFPGDFSVEAWVYLTSALSGSNGAYLADFRNASASNQGFALGFIGSSGATRVYAASVFGSVVDVIGSSTVSLNQWNFVSYIRSESTLTMRLNGSSQGTLSSSASQGNAPLIIGARFTGTTEYLAGYADDLRITKGVARDGSVVPTAPFPDS